MIDIVHTLLDRQGRRVGREIKFLCPSHEDSNPSAYFNPDKQVWYCQACGAKGNLRNLHEALGLPWEADQIRAGIDLPKGIPTSWFRKPARHLYDYRDTDGSLLGWVVRYQSGDEKDIIPFFKKGTDADAWASGGGRKPTTLYRQELVHRHNLNIVWIVEGEKCVDAIVKLGEAVAVTSIGGSKRAHKADWSILAGRDVVVWPDNDNPGKHYQNTVIAMLPDDVRTVQVIHPEEVGLSGKGDDAFDWLRAHPGATYDDLLALPRHDPPKGNVLNPADFHAPPRSPGGGDDGPPPEDFSWIDLLKVTKEGKVKASLANLIIIFDNHPEWKGRMAYNERSLRETIQQKIPIIDDFVEGMQLEDQHARLSSLWLHNSQFNMTAPSAVVHEALATVARRHPYDPVRDYFDNLPDWDGVERIDHWLPDCAGSVADEYTHAVGPAFLISAIARTYDPGCKVDTMLILCGPQGSLKSTLLSVLAGEFFSDQLGDVGNKDSLMQICGPLIIEMKELESTNRREVTTIKAFLDTRVDMFRPPYGRTMLNFPRRCVFAGTTNEETFLRDDTGGRRFWPVDATGINVQLARENRDQYWAEALHRYKQGEIWWLQGIAEQKAKLEQERRRQVDPWEMTINNYLRKTAVDYDRRHEEDYNTLTGERIFVTIEEVMKSGLELPVHQRKRGEAMRVGNILRNAGWERRQQRVNNQRVWVYFPPKEKTEDDT